MGQTSFSGPMKIGTVREGANVNLGGVVLTQTVALAQNSTTAVSGTMKVPANAQILDLYCDVGTAYNSGTSATLSVGTAAAGTQYVGSVDVKSAAGRISAAFTGAQLLAMANVGANTSVVATVTPSGSTSAGHVRVTMLYRQN